MSGYILVTFKPPAPSPLPSNLNPLSPATSSPADKLHWVFQMYDKDNSNTIQLSEMVELFGTLYLSEGLEKEAAVDRAQRVAAVCWLLMTFADIFTT